MTISTGYLQHGSDTNGPFRTESVTIKHLYADQYQAFFEGRWRKIYVREKGDYIKFLNYKIQIKYEGNCPGHTDMTPIYKPI